MRYQCRIAGEPKNYDARFPGTYNARLDSLAKFWAPLFGYSHGILIVDSFYENVARSKMEGRVLAEGENDENVVLQFTPRDGNRMLIACLWSKWTGPCVPDLYSFAAITDEPPPEVAEAGHDRCIVPIKPENVAAWLNPNPEDLAAQYAILKDKVMALHGRSTVGGEPGGHSRWLLRSYGLVTGELSEEQRGGGSLHVLFP
jgi:putative SOS response-associated peptidase YedK